MNRRHFLMSSAGVLAAARHAMPSPNDTVRVACVGVRGRGKDHMKAYGRIANVEIAAICDIDESVLNKAASQLSETAGHVFGPAQAARRQIHRRDLHRHAQSLAHAADHLGLPGGQGCVCREALLARHVRSQANRGGRAKVQPHRAAGQPKPLVAGAAGSGAEHARRPAGRRLHGPRLVLQMARHHRPHAGRTGAAGRALRPLARARRRSTRSPRIVFTTTGTGSGTTATATWATRAFTRWTSLAGDWA